MSPCATLSILERSRTFSPLESALPHTLAAPPNVDTLALTPHDVLREVDAVKRKRKGRAGRQRACRRRAGARSEQNPTGIEISCRHHITLGVSSSANFEAIFAL